MDSHFKKDISNNLAYPLWENHFEKFWSQIYANKAHGYNLPKSPKQAFMRIAEKLYNIEKKYPKPFSKNIIFKLLDNSEYIILSKDIVHKLIYNEFVETLLNGITTDRKYKFTEKNKSLIFNSEYNYFYKNKISFNHNLNYLNPENNSIKKIIYKYFSLNKDLKAEDKKSHIVYSISINHPSIIDLLEIDIYYLHISGISFSIIIDDKFMKLVKNNKTSILKYPINSESPIITKKINAQFLLNKLSDRILESVSFEIRFSDVILNKSIKKCYYPNLDISSNFTGLLTVPYENADLASINLLSFVENPFLPNAKFNFNKFTKYVKITIHLLDNVVDLNISFINKHITEIDKRKKPEYNLFKKIKSEIDNYRRIGLSVLGFADMLAALNLKYGSKQSKDFTNKLFYKLSASAYNSSVELAQERGAFKKYDFYKEQGNIFLDELYNKNHKLKKNTIKYGRRNISLIELITVGSTSLLADVSCVTQPINEIVISMFRMTNDNKYNPHYRLMKIFLIWLKQNNYNLKKIKNYDIRKINNIIEASPFKNYLSSNISITDKLIIKKTIENWIDGDDASVVIVNKETSINDVNKIIITAWNNKLKSLTLYRSIK